MGLHFAVDYTKILVATMSLVHLVEPKILFGIIFYWLDVPLSVFLADGNISIETML